MYRTNQAGLYFLHDFKSKREATGGKLLEMLIGVSYISMRSLT